MLEWLEWRRIELPAYYTLQTIITTCIRDRNRKVRQRFRELLTQEHQKELEKLMEKQVESGREEYILTTLQKLSPSDSPKTNQG